MDTLLDLIQYLIVLCDVAAAPRIIYCLIRMKGNPDEAPSYIKKIINLLIFLILANTVLVSLALVRSYFE